MQLRQNGCTPRSIVTQLEAGDRHLQLRRAICLRGEAQQIGKNYLCERGLLDQYVGIVTPSGVGITCPGSSVAESECGHQKTISSGLRSAECSAHQWGAQRGLT